ncbi:hypothetical protein KFL_006740040 [Klebsormidium nitens]|uniref:Amidase domain-containing protein n=1 Tax=Klebsormidium nitens TaxID=105231 RepID=A0A1Y1IIH8_KLENI|nr:hypothetical protein KFL_006740040 [Klebsormidium nitens]|eukprot:GAQ90690.1 hypothetical protein KFL_006740040 [Klebsormidium nitens]
MRRSAALPPPITALTGSCKARCSSERALAGLQLCSTAASKVHRLRVAEDGILRQNGIMKRGIRQFSVAAASELIAAPMGPGIAARSVLWRLTVVALLVQAVCASSRLPLQVAEQLRGRQDPVRKLLQTAASVPPSTDGTAPIGIPAPSSGFCASAMYPTTCTIPGTATPYCCPAGYSCFPGSGYACYKQSPDGSFPSQPSNFGCGAIIEIGLDTIQELFMSGQLTSRALVECYLKRIADYDSIATFAGMAPYAINSVLEIDPDVLAIAEARDQERMACLPECALSKLHGVPIGLKDNINSDGMNATAGSWNLLGSYHKQAPIVDLLIAAGGIIMAKMGLSEWAFFRAGVEPNAVVSGWSGRGGQVYDPYVRYQPVNITARVSPYPEVPSAIPAGSVFTAVNSPTIVSGSSGGSGAGTATNMVAVTVGSETGGSVLLPARNNGIVGFRPTVGVMSRNGIVPLGATQDTAGPMCRYVADCLYMFDAMAYDDLADPIHSGATPWLPPYTRPAGGYLPYLKKDGLAGKKIAVVPLPATTTGPAVAAYAALPDLLRSRGATVDVLPSNFAFLTLGGNLFNGDFKVDINLYLSQLTWKAGYTVQKSLADMIEYNKKNYELEFQGGVCCRGDPAYANMYQQSWEASQATGDKRDAAYLSARTNSSIIAASISDFFKSNSYDAVASNGNLIGTWARIGFPGLTVPCLGVNAVGLPQGITLHGYPYNEGDLFAIGYDIEQNLCPGGRPKPTYCNSQSC